MRRWLSSCSFLIALAFSVADASGQSFQGGLRGAVKDANGVIPGVVVVLTNEGTNVAAVTRTNNSGQYLFDFVIGGNYSVTVEMQGFRKFVQKNIVVQSRGDVTVDARLEVGSASEAVTVAFAVPFPRESRPFASITTSCAASSRET